MSKRGPDWEALVPFLIHPTKVWVIEAFRCINRPLSSSDLERICDRTFGLSAIAYHVKSLAKLGVLQKVEERRVRGVWEKLYVLCPKPEPPKGR